MSPNYYTGVAQPKLKNHLAYHEYNDWVIDKINTDFFVNTNENIYIFLHVMIAQK
jgi:hypothetical protein